MPRRPSTHVDSAAAVGRRLREARERAGLSQRELAFEGCTPAYISRIEAGARTPSLQLLREFGRRLGVSADYLATGNEKDDSVSDALLNAELLARTGEVDEARRLYRELLDDPASSPVFAAAARLDSDKSRSGPASTKERSSSSLSKRSRLPLWLSATVSLLPMHSGVRWC